MIYKRVKNDLSKESFLEREGIALFCPHLAFEYCSDKCPFHEVEGSKVTLRCTGVAFQFFLEEEEI